MLYGVNVWDPILIISQIVALQAVFYLISGLLQLVSLGRYIPQLSISYIFDYRHLSFTSMLGWMEIIVNLATALLGAVFMARIVERAKKCLDFGMTCYFIHFICCWHYRGFPKSAAWWMTNIVGMTLMVLLGEWLCVRREMQDIPIAQRERRSTTPPRGGAGGGGGSGVNINNNINNNILSGGNNNGSITATGGITGSSPAARSSHDIQLTYLGGVLSRN
uniref:Protein SYS1 homolog n=1 Tax=Polytomella parva TaxID=51329 RepID=A0A7S0V3X6_9CHLO|mmetsp:Transcript_29727/g.54490  ORF Transcript_29727/g.54490 Transcript_29727/m.54490 type:complete len:220 (+) Transcript_29727:132-791(+)